MLINQLHIYKESWYLIIIVSSKAVVAPILSPRDYIYAINLFFCLLCFEGNVIATKDVDFEDEGLHPELGLSNKSTSVKVRKRSYFWLNVNLINASCFVF